VPASGVLGERLVPSRASLERGDEVHESYISKAERGVTSTEGEGPCVVIRTLGLIHQTVIGCIPPLLSATRTPCTDVIRSVPPFGGLPLGSRKTSGDGG
jgi:hypothetical protein